MNDGKKNGTLLIMVAGHATVFALAFLFTMFLLVLCGGGDLIPSAISSAKAGGVVTAITALCNFVVFQYQKNRPHGIAYGVMIVLAVVAVYLSVTENDRRAEERQELIDQIEEDPGAYISNDLMYDYIENHIDDVMNRFDLYSFDYVDELQTSIDNAYQSGAEQGYADGWEDCCDNYGIVEAETPTSTVYVTDYGNRYHRANCIYLTNSKTELTLEEAQDSGYTACSVCGG